MIKFIYSNGHPENFEESEIEIKEKYKSIVEQFPNELIQFDWTGKIWSISALDAVRIAMNELDNDNAL